jgi:ApaG protein
MTDDPAFSETTREIRVTVRAFYLDDQSDATQAHYVWAYRVRLENLGSRRVRLLRRSWSITDGMGRTQHIQGEGVVGETPVLPPGGAFEYTSGTPLPTPSGFMRGRYHMVDLDSAEAFDVAIPAFSLDSPHQPGGVH